VCAFVVWRARMQGVVVKEEPGVEFLSAKSFAGSKPGYVFKAGASGLGYYRDRAHTTYAGSAAHARDVSRQAAGGDRAAMAAAVVKQEAEPKRLSIKVPPEGLPSAVPQTPGLPTARGSARQSKKRERKARENEVKF
jgi:hypothetical protein